MAMETPLSYLPDDMQEFWDNLSPEDKRLSLGDAFGRLEENACDLDAIELTTNTLTGLRNRIAVQFIEERYHPATRLCLDIIEQLDIMVGYVGLRRHGIVGENVKNQMLRSVLEYKEVIERMAYIP